MKEMLQSDSQSTNDSDQEEIDEGRDFAFEESMYMINHLKKFALQNAQKFVAQISRLWTCITDICAKTKMKPKQSKIINFLS